MAELDRIVQRREAAKEMKEVRMNNVPKIIAVANEEGNPHFRALCDEANGNLINSHCKVFLIHACV